MKNTILIISYLAAFALLCNISSYSQSTKAAKPVKYDTIIRKHVDKPVVKPVTRPAEVILPVPEYINQPYYYDKDDNKLIKLENATAQMITKKKTLGLKGAKQTLTMEATSSKIRFIAKKDILFFIKTSGDVIDLTSYIKLYQFIPADQKREVTVNAKEGLLNNKEDAKGKSISFGVKMISKDTYTVQFTEPLEAGEYGFVWVKNMELKEFAVFAFGIDWKSSD